MDISAEELQKKRSPAALKAFVDTVIDFVRSNPSEFQEGMLKKGYYKEFLDEIRPLAHFAQQQYPETYEIKPILGNQGYDVIVYNDLGEECERLELTRPHDGAAAANDAKLVVERGYGDVSVGQPGSDFERLVPFVVSTCKNKALKDYKDCTLVIYISPEPPHRGFENRFTDTLKRLITLLTSITFNAKRVVLFIHPDRTFTIRDS